jgi:Photosystem II 12 kDa extrinsic protein (PsbU)
MRFLYLIMFINPVLAFMPISVGKKDSTALNVQRRDVLIAGLTGLAGLPNLVNAKSSTFFYDDKIEEKPVEPSQMPTSGKLDLNSAFVVSANFVFAVRSKNCSNLLISYLFIFEKGEYSKLPGMYPHAAGKIASNGPYQKVNDIYKIKGLTSTDVQLFKQYESKFTVNPPGRSFSERINSRVST